jgi:acyl carrier protein
VCEVGIGGKPSRLTGDVPCPRCGKLLWFVVLPSETLVYPLDELPVQRRQWVAEAGERLARSRVDSLDIIEWVMEWEEEFDLTIPDSEVQKFKGLGDLIDYFLRRRPDEDPPDVL